MGWVLARSRAPLLCRARCTHKLTPSSWRTTASLDEDPLPDAAMLRESLRALWAWEAAAADKWLLYCWADASGRRHHADGCAGQSAI